MNTQDGDKKRSRQGDLEPVASISDEDGLETTKLLAQLHKHAEEHARGSINWYLKARKPKKRCARYMRAGAILLVGLAGIIPVLSEMESLEGIPAGIATIALGLSALLIAYDRFFGCSTAWMRYIATEHSIRQALHRYQYDMEELRLQWTGGQPDEAQALAYLSKSRDFIVEVDGLVRAETDLWLAEFRDSIDNIDAAIRDRKSLPVGTGGVNLTLTNANDVEGDWGLSIDRRPVENRSGASAAVSGLSPGSHSLRVTGTVSGEVRAQERLVDVQADSLSDVQIEL